MLTCRHVCILVYMFTSWLAYYIVDLLACCLAATPTSYLVSLMYFLVA